ncbi:MAG: SufD family Fe-S cluster assembly protein, partial [Bacilli bacterium]|nr:SufD family Fe-S cluster assembly protein [Bacilli bacterium]
MNKLEVVTRNKIIGNTDGLALDFNKDILTITITKDCKDSIRFINSIYHNVSIIVEDNANVVFTEIKGFEVAEESKYTYTLGDNSKVIINRFNYMGNYNEKTDVNLNGYQSDILFNLSVMSKGHQQYNINISHNNKKTVSNLYNHGVTLGDGTMDLTVNGY